MIKSFLKAIIILQKNKKSNKKSTTKSGFFYRAKKCKAIVFSVQFKSALIMTCLVFSFSISLFAWFSNQTHANAEQVKVSIAAPSMLDISIDDGATFKNEFYFDEISLLKNLNLLDITGNGITFLRPLLKDGGASAEPVEGSGWRTPTPNIEYVSVNVIFRTAEPMDIYMAYGTCIDAVSPKLNLNSEEVKDPNDIYNASSYGDFSRDALVGAVRLSVLDSANTRKLLWLPHPELYLDSDSDPYILYNNIADATYNTYVHEYFATSGSLVKSTINESNGLVFTDDFTATQSVQGTDKTKIATTDGIPDEEGYYYDEVKINIWVEGCDAEAKRALSLGRFNVLLKFVSFSVE